MNPVSSPAAVRSWTALSVLALALGGCISGRILEGYPGYPFLSFEIEAPPDSGFFGLQAALEAEGFEIDFTERAAGLINTRPATRATGEMFVTVVLEGATEVGAAGDPDAAGEATPTRVWVAAYEPVPDGAERIDPLHEAAWAELLAIAASLSERLGGTPPEAPEAPGS